MVLNRQYYEMGKISKKRPRICLYFCNPKEKKVLSQLPTVMQKMPRGMFMCSPMSYMNDNSLYVIFFWSDTIYCANDPLKLKPHAVIKRDNFRSISDNEVYRDLISGKIKNRNILNLVDIAESSRFTFFRTNFGLAVFDKVEKTQFILNGKTVNNLYSNFQYDLYGKAYVIPRSMCYLGTQDRIYSHMQPDAFLEQKTVEHKIKDARYQKFEEMKNSIKEDDNPIIMIIKLKK